MATSSFSKNFVVNDPIAIQRFKDAANKPRKIVTKKRDYDADRETGIESLVRKLNTKPPAL